MVVFQPAVPHYCTNVHSSDHHRDRTISDELSVLLRRERSRGAIVQSDAVELLKLGFGYVADTTRASAMPRSAKAHGAGIARHISSNLAHSEDDPHAQASAAVLTSPNWERLLEVRHHTPFAVCAALKVIQDGVVDRPISAKATTTTTTDLSLADNGYKPTLPCIKIIDE
jgi:hypothetical protein